MCINMLYSSSGRRENSQQSANSVIDMQTGAATALYMFKGYRTRTFLLHYTNMLIHGGICLCEFDVHREMLKVVLLFYATVVS